VATSSSIVCGLQAMPNCKFCGKPYKSNGVCLQKHEASCNKAPQTAPMHASSLFKCALCGKEYKSRRKDYDNHIVSCGVSNQETLSPNMCLNELFPFTEDFFVESADFTELPEKQSDWIDNLLSKGKVSAANKFSIFHLNINSLFAKFHHIYEIIDRAKPDIFCLNETKLDHCLPDSAIHINGYNFFRRDRGSKGGGVLVYIRKCYKILNSYISLDYELIHIKFSISRQNFNLFACYKPPNELAEPFLEFLETKINALDQKESLFIAGDLNLDWQSAKGAKLREFCDRITLSNAIYVPTRSATVSIGGHARLTSSLIDVILHNTKLISSSSVINFPFSDHSLVVVLVNVNKPIERLEERLSRKLNKVSLASILNEIKAADFSILYSIDDINLRWHLFKRFIMNITDAHAPLKRPPKRKNSCVPWYDDELVAKKANLLSLFKNYCRSNCSDDWLAFRDARAAYQSLFRKKKIAFFVDKTAKSFKISRQFWQFYSSSVKLKKSNDGSRAPKSIIINHTTLSDTAVMAEKFNSFFVNLNPSSNVSLEEAKRAVNKNFKTNMCQMLPQALLGAFSFKHVSPTIISKFLKELDDLSSPGISGIPTIVLKQAAEHIAPFLASLFNDCIRKCIFPDEFKFAIVSPLFKSKGSAHDMNNYRGISVLPPVCKVFERIMAEQLRLYFSINKLFFPGQHGFRPFHSCESALHEIVSHCLTNLDKKKINLLLFIDFKKAFDLVNPDLLLIKLLNYGLANDAILLIRNYFDKRLQAVKISNSVSIPANINLGVPQGSVLGPLFFIIYINDLPFFMSSILTKLFADDTTLLFEGEHLDDLLMRCKSGVRLLLEWCELNYLYVNWTKTYAMFITNKRLVLPKALSVEAFNIEIVEKFKLLGVTIDTKLNFVDHVANVAKAINIKLFAIKRLFYLSFEVKLQFFKTFILPYFDYCLSLIIYFSKQAINKMAKIYYTCLFKLFKLKFVGQDIFAFNNSLKQYKLYSFTHRVVYKLHSFIFSIKTQDAAPIKLKECIKAKVMADRYELRASSRLAFEQHLARSKFGEWSFSNFYTKLLNKIEISRNLLLVNSQTNFSIYLSVNIDKIINEFLKHFCKFDIDLNLAFIYF
jgi:hypothetical protein